VIDSDLATLCDNLSELLMVPGQISRLRGVVLDLAVSGRLLASGSTENATEYLADIMVANEAQKAAKKLTGVDSRPLGVEVPDSWARTMLGYISSDIRYGTSEKTSDSGDVPVLRMGNIQNQQLDFANLKFLPTMGRLKKLMLADGDILFNRTNSPALVGKSAVFHGDASYTFASYLIRVRVRSEINPDFVNLWLGSPSGRAWATRVKTDAIGQSNINGTILGQFPLALPTADEQDAIVERVEAIFSLIESFEVGAQELEMRRRRTTGAACNALVRVGEPLVLDQAHELIRTFADVDQLERAIFELAVTGQLVTQRQEEGEGRSLVAGFLTEPAKRRAGQSLDNRVIETPFEIPTSWAWATLGIAGTLVGGGTPRSERSDCFSEDPSSGTPWFTPADLGGNSSIYVSNGRRSLTDVGLRSSSAQLLPAGAVLFSSRAPIGYVAILDGPGSTNQGVKSFVPHEGLVSEFAYFWLRYWAPEIDAAAPSVTFREVNKKAMARQPIPIPPTQEQFRIVERVFNLMALVRTLRTRIAA
jgi:restriction endonuclease S subunit